MSLWIFLFLLIYANFGYFHDILKINIRTKIDLILSQIKLGDTLLIKLENETPDNRQLYFEYLLRMFDKCYIMAVQSCESSGVKAWEPLFPDSEPYNLIVEHFSNLMEKYQSYIAQCTLRLRKKRFSRNDSLYSILLQTPTRSTKHREGVCTTFNDLVS